MRQPGKREDLHRRAQNNNGRDKVPRVVYTESEKCEFIGALSIDMREGVDWIASHLSPDDVFLISDLEAWVEDNGYTKEDER
jgi:hypothetical protein